MIERSYKARKIPEKHQYRAVVIDGHKIIKTAVFFSGCRSYCRRYNNIVFIY